MSISSRSSTSSSEHHGRHDDNELADGYMSDRNFVMTVRSLISFVLLLLSEDAMCTLLCASDPVFSQGCKCRGRDISSCEGSTAALSSRQNVHTCSGPFLYTHASEQGCAVYLGRLRGISRWPGCDMSRCARRRTQSDKDRLTFSHSACTPTFAQVVSEPNCPRSGDETKM